MPRIKSTPFDQRFTCGYIGIATEYYALSHKPRLSEEEAARLAIILDAACDSDNISLLLNEINELVFKENSLESKLDTHHHYDQRARVSELAGCGMVGHAIPAHRIVFEHASLNLMAYEPILASYCRLLRLSVLSEIEQEEMSLILEEALQDGLLGLLLDIETQAFLGTPSGVTKRKHTRKYAIAGAVSSSALACWFLVSYISPLGKVLFKASYPSPNQTALSNYSGPQISDADESSSAEQTPEESITYTAVPYEAVAPPKAVPIKDGFVFEPINESIPPQTIPVSSNGFSTYSIPIPKTLPLGNHESALVKQPQQNSEPPPLTDNKEQKIESNSSILELHLINYPTVSDLDTVVEHMPGPDFLRVDTPNSDRLLLIEDPVDMPFAQSSDNRAGDTQSGGNREATEDVSREAVNLLNNSKTD